MVVLGKHARDTVGEVCAVLYHRTYAYALAITGERSAPWSYQDV